jgi:DNA-binding MarR family transcriptional regulator
MTKSLAFQSALREWSELFMQLSMGEMLRCARENGLTMAQVGVLMRIRGKGMSGVAGVGEDLGITSAAASQLLDKLSRQGLVLREEDPDDRRSKRILLTERGEGLSARIMAARGRWIEELEAMMSPQELEAAGEALKLIAAGMREIASKSHDERGRVCSV